MRKRKIEGMMGKTISGLMFDERIDKTKILLGEGIKKHKRFKLGREEHCCCWVRTESARWIMFSGSSCPRAGNWVRLGPVTEQFPRGEENHTFISTYFLLRWLQQDGRT